MEWRTKAWGGGDVEFKVVPSIVTVSVDLCSYPKFLHKKFVNSPSLYYGYSAPRHHHIDDRTENNCIMLLMAYHFTANNSSLSSNHIFINGPYLSMLSYLLL
jgi:hypothetical protein